ncbi:MAG TPA: GspH/FimT family pseudopilin, partial [Syntrophales bacterium]|nr:GspH/FimT family pseudopilin [Syntrophales bacterium]
MIIERSNSRGFSLVELLIAIAILAILGAISIPTFRHYLAQRRLNGAVRELQNSLMAMRMQAVTENRWIAMNIGSNHQFTIFRDVNKNGVLDSVEAVSVKDIHPTYYDVTFT